MGEQETKRAEAAFRKAEVAKESASNTAAYRAEKTAVLDRTERLRSERVVREATEVKTPLAAPPPAKPKKKKAK